MTKAQIKTNPTVFQMHNDMPKRRKYTRNHQNFHSEYNLKLELPRCLKNILDIEVLKIYLHFEVTDKKQSPELIGDLIQTVYAQYLPMHLNSNASFV